MGCVIKSFRLQLPEMKKLSKEDKQNQMRRAFGYQYGMRFDEYHSSILTDGVINLSYSYLTFKMQSIDEQDDDDYQFDVEEYNYLINNRTALHDPDLIKNTKDLDYVLKNLNKIDTQLLEQL